MRPLEILTPILLAIHLVWPLSGRFRPLPVRLLPAGALLVVALHATLEGARWQMLPLYSFTGVMFVFHVATSLRSEDTRASANGRWGILQVALGVGLLAVSTALPVLLPVPSIPDPNGPYAVGTRTIELADGSREELYSGLEGPRRFQIQVWYPAEVDPADKRAPWMANAGIVAPAIATYIDMPSFFLDHLKLVRLPAYQESPVVPVDGGLPIILFSHGWNGFSAQNTGQALQLASHGYVVAGIQHTYGAVITVFEDGTVAPNNPSALPRGAPDAEYDTAARLLGDQWASDMAYALDILESQNRDPGSPFNGSLDLQRVGVYGHSTGGGAAIQFCGTDSRCDAVLGMDPFMRPVSQEILERGLDAPAFFMFSQAWTDETDSVNNRLFSPFYAKLQQPLGVISINGTAHYDFTDLPLLSPLAPQLGLKGPISGRQVTRIINDYLLAFFDLTLKDGSGALFSAGSQPYTEVRFTP